LLRQRHPPIKHLAIALNAPVREIEARNAVEYDTRAPCRAMGGIEAEAVTRVAKRSRGHGIVELPAKIASSRCEMSKHIFDRLTPSTGSKKIVVIGPFGGEQVGQGIPVEGFHGGCKPFEQMRKVHRGLLYWRAPGCYGIASAAVTALSAPSRWPVHVERP